jgi:flagellar hook assembly protein FlgD
VYPYLLEIQAYNEAGELVKIIAQTTTNAPVTGFDTYVGTTQTSSFNAAATPGMTFRINNVWTPDKNGPGVTYVDFPWDGTNQNGQDVGQGVYYIKMSVVDEFGHTVSIIKDISLVRSEEYTRLSIYNSAGELVRRITDYNQIASTSIDLSGMDDPIYVGTGALVPLKIGPSASVSWDGKNSEGNTVANGIYEVQVEIKTADGYKVVSSRSITVMATDDQSVLTDPSNAKAFPKVYPNPMTYMGDDFTTQTATIEWFAAVPGRITIRIYNVAGELVKSIPADLAAKSVKWDVRTEGGESLASGLYVFVLQARTLDGKTETRMTKWSLIKRMAGN